MKTTTIALPLVETVDLLLTGELDSLVLARLLHVTESELQGALSEQLRKALYMRSRELHRLERLSWKMREKESEATEAEISLVDAEIKTVREDKRQIERLINSLQPTPRSIKTMLLQYGV